MRKFIATLCTVTLLLSCASLAVAQDAATIRAIFASAQKVPTNIPGVTMFAGPPKGFNPLTASGEELAKYGLPQRPNQQTEPEHYTKWAKAMTALTHQPNAKLKAMPWHGSPAKLLSMPQAATAAQTLSNVPTTLGSLNWRGGANANKLTKWNVNTSFTYIESFWDVPVAQPPLNACANGITGPFLESTWNGIDGFNSGDVIQAGTELYSDCGGSGDSAYLAWIEWYPSYPELEIDAPVGPGDVMYVVTYGTAGTAEQTVFVEDTTQGWGGSFGLTWVTGPGVIGNSEEQVVERPCCNGSDFYALNHYNYEFFADAQGLDGHGTSFYVGEQSVTTYSLQMYNDAGTQIISEPLEEGSVGTAGKYMLFMSDEGCAYSGGCTP
jgi:hypothetical protein